MIRRYKSFNDLYLDRRVQGEKVVPNVATGKGKESSHPSREGGCLGKEGEEIQRNSLEERGKTPEGPILFRRIKKGLFLCASSPESVKGGGKHGVALRMAKKGGIIRFAGRTSHKKGGDVGRSRREKKMPNLQPLPLLAGRPRLRKKQPSILREEGKTCDVVSYEQKSP